VSSVVAAQVEPRRLELPSLDRNAAGEAVQLPGHWFRASVPGRAPAIVLLHGCGGPYRRGEVDRLSARMHGYAQLLNAEGVHVLVIDSFTPRGERELCTQRTGTRKVTQAHRRRDTLGALQWLAAQPEVDGSRLGLLGWSHGGSNVLASTNGRHAEVASAAVRAAFAVAFYPGCEADLARGYRPTAALLMLLGAADDWTPAAPCQALVAQAGAPRPQLEIYAAAHHGFDGAAPVRLLKEVPNGARPGQGVHVGGDPAAREASRERLLAFVRLAIGVRAAPAGEGQRQSASDLEPSRR